jgi:uncharacterized membrane-anchored protein
MRQPGANRSHFSGEHQPKEPKLMWRGKSSLFAVFVACLIAAAWSGVGMADDITSANVGTMAANAKTAQDYEALGNYYDAQAKAAQQQADDAKAQYDAIHKPMGKRTGSDAEVIDTQRIFAKRAVAHYKSLAEQDSKIAAMYHKLGKAGGAQ